MKQKLTISFLLVVFMIFCTFPAHSDERVDHHTIRVGVFPLEPLNYYDAEGVAQGLNPDLLRRVVQELHWKVVFVPGNWAENLDRLQREEIDLMTMVAYTPERALVMDYNKEPVVDIWGQVFVRPGENINNILDLDSRVVAIVRKDINGQNFLKTAEKFGIQCSIVEFPTHDDIFKAIKSGDVDAGIAPQHFGFRKTDEYGLVASSIQFSPFSVYFTSKKGKQHDLLQHIDSYLSRWKQDKKSYYYERLSYWMGGKKYEKEIIPFWVIIIVGVVVSIALLLVVVNRFLNSQIKKRTRELYASEKQYKELVESANSIILRWDKNSNVIFMNEYGLNLFGYSREEIVGRSVTESIVPEKESTGRDLEFMIKDILTNPKKYELNENENICKDGSRVFIQWTNKAIVDEDGVFMEMLSVGTDITERKKLEHELQQSRKMEAIGTLAGGIAHDFNNALAVIFGFTELAEIHKNDPITQSDDLGQVFKAATRAKDLVDQILTFSRKADFEKHDLQLSIYVKEVVKMMRATIPSTISIEENIKSESKVLIDPTQIHQVIMNLCTNACHAMELDGGTINVSINDVTLDSEQIEKEGLDFAPGDYVQLEVSDSGYGIAPENMEKIFDPYFTTKELGKGTGMGLAVAHGIVKEHNGDLKVYSVEGEGTTFQVYFPKITEYKNEKNKVEDVEQLSGGNEKIMVIDDEQKIAEALSGILSEYGYLVSVFTDGEAALGAFRKDSNFFDVVVTDMTMPNMTGAQLANELLHIRPELPVILCTGFSKLMNKEKSQEMGIAAYIKKPVLKEDLLKSIRKILDR